MNLLKMFGIEVALQGIALEQNGAYSNYVRFGSVQRLLIRQPKSVS